MNNYIIRLKRSLRFDQPHPEHGQSLVEMAVVLPLLLLMLLGVFEVGWAVRGYLTLVNVNREITRFAARGVYLDFESTAMSSTSTCVDDVQNDPFGIGYCKVISHAALSLAGQLPMDFVNETGNSSVIITYYEVTPRSGFNCLGDTTCSNFDCTRFTNKSHASGYILGTDLADVKYPRLSVAGRPGLAGSANIPSYYDTSFNITNTTAVTKFHYHRGGPYFSRINPKDRQEEVRGEVNKLNCQLTQKGLPTVGDNLVIVETTYNQNQLVGLPLVTRFVPNPVPLYSHTAMRVSTDLRKSDTSDTACELYPMMIPFSAFTGGVRQGQDITLTRDNNVDVPGNFGFLAWNSTDSANAGNLMSSFNDPTRATTQFKDYTDHTDNILNVGDWIQADTGNYGNSIAGPNPGMDDMLSRGKLIFPVWDDTGCAVSGSAGTRCPGAAVGTGNTARFKVVTFVVMEAKVITYTGSTKGVTFEFSNFDPGACTCDPETDGAACDPL